MTEPAAAGFDDLLQANARYASTFPLSGFDGIARAGIAMVTCMDSRIDPLGMIGLQPGDAKILRNPGGRVSDEALTGLVLAVHLLGVRRVMVVEHTRCAMASSTEAQLRERVGVASGRGAPVVTFGVIADQEQQVAEDVDRVRSHRLIPDHVEVGGFLYDVDTGVIHPVA